ncbi:MAG: hypothetical protein PHH11_10730 [Methylomonas sp.]|nr:hypothetical protein [Methylomonas sp.]
MNDYLKAMMDEAIASIDALSIDELEKEFRAFGIDVVRKQDAYQQLDSICFSQFDSKSFSVTTKTPIQVEDFTSSRVNQVSSANDESYCCDDYIYKFSA